ncbi:MAG: hypothetical protein G01um101425_266 [Candidatus Peregrinibacteria bacterium Gr01-1014_25]|nr:MAG: hypothetical protein G01um101425_266 [Candidatus Peregrinibacteria bacterium Gr01-1014_25]
MLRLRRRCVLPQGALRAAGLGIVAIIGVAAVTAALFSPMFTVQEIRVQRSDPRIDFEQVQNAIGSIYGRHLLLLTSSDVEAPLREVIPDLRTVTVRKRYPQTLWLRLTLDPIIARMEILEPDGSKPIVPDEPGPVADLLSSRGMYLVYTPAQMGSGAALPTVEVTDWGARPSPWSIIVDEHFLAAMQQAETLLAQRFGQIVRRRTIFLRAREFHLTVDKISLWFDIRSPVDEQLARYRNFLDALGPSAAARYIDLRIRGKVVYR